MTHLQDYQRAIAKALRDGGEAPFSLEEARFAVYRRLVFNNLSSFVDQCFPIASGLLGTTQWRHLCEQFFRESQCHSPLFKDIPETFLNWVEERPDKPAWLHDLMHYEWLELAAYHHLADVNDTLERVETALIDEAHDTRRVCLNPTLQFGLYPRPVHLFAMGHPIPDADGQWYGFLVFRTTKHEVKFHSVNATTLQLLQHLQHDASVWRACQMLSQQLPGTRADTLLPHTLELLGKLMQDQIVLGYQKRIMAAG